jgi:hypothetical protein
MPTKFGKTITMNHSDTAGDLTNTVWKEMKCDRFKNIYHQQTALSLMSMKILQNGPQYITITDIWGMLPKHT